MRRFNLGWKTSEHPDGLGVKITSDADGLVIGSLGAADKVLLAAQYTRRGLKLMSNETGARLGPILVGTVLDSTVRDGPLGFVGYAIEPR